MSDDDAQPDDDYDPRLLARQHFPETLAKIVWIRDHARRDTTSLHACRLLAELAYPNMETEHVKALVEERIQKLIAEAERRRRQPKGLGEPPR